MTVNVCFSCFLCNSDAILLRFSYVFGCFAYCRYLVHREVTDQLLQMPFLEEMASVYGKTPASLIWKMLSPCCEVVLLLRCERVGIYYIYI